MYDWPLVTSTSTVKLDDAYQAAAIRLAPPGTSSAGVAVEGLAQVYAVAPAGVTVTPAGRELGLVVLGLLMTS